MAESNSTAKPLTELQRGNRIDDLFCRCVATTNLLTIAFQHHGEELREDTIPHAAFAMSMDLDELKELIEGGAS